MDFPPADVVRVLGELLSPERAARIESVLDHRLAGLTVVLEDLYDPHNGAAALRSLEALGIGTLHVIEREHPFRFSPKVSQGCERWVERIRHPDAASCASALRASGFLVYGAVPGARTTLAELPYDRPLALAFGNEHAGLTPEARAMCDGEFGLELHGMTRSFNLSVAVALAAREAVARRREARGAPGDLEAHAKEHLRAKWYHEDVRGAEAILARRLGSTTRSASGE